MKFTAEKRANQNLGWLSHTINRSVKAEASHQTQVLRRWTFLSMSTAFRSQGLGSVPRGLPNRSQTTHSVYTRDRLSAYKCGVHSLSYAYGN